MAQNTKSKQTNTKQANASVTNGEQAGAAEKVDRIRDLIFGQQIRDYDQKLDTVNKDLVRLQGEINRLTDELHEQERTFMQKLREQEQGLSTQLQEQDRRHTQQHRELDQRLTQQIQDVDRRHTQNTQELWQALRELESSMRNELRMTAQELDELKMDRFTLGELFIALGGNLKQSKPKQEAVDLLAQLDNELSIDIE